MLKLLLDEHISLEVANGLRRRIRAIEIRYMVEWEDGYFLGQGDAACLREAATQGLTLVTYDRRTIPPCSSPGRKKSERTPRWFLWTKKQFRPRTSAVWSGP